MGSITQREVRALITRHGLIHDETHVILPTGMHSRVFLDKRELVTTHGVLDSIAHVIGDRFDRDSIRVVISSKGDAAELAMRAARWLAKYAKTGVQHIIAKEGPGDVFILDPIHSTDVANRNVLIVEDVVTAGGTVRSLIRAATSLGGKPIAVGAIWNRGGVSSEDLGVPFRPLIDIPVTSWPPDLCPLCADKVPIAWDLRPT
jgi:orotate phosphoribosyltransferase